MTFHHPSIWLLALLVLLPILWWRWSGGRRHGAIAFSSVGIALAAGTTWATRLRWIVPALRSVAIGVLIICVARPQKADEHTRVFAEGIAIGLIIDRSGSMLAEDFMVGRQRVSRLDAVKAVVEDFIDGGEHLPGRPDDLIGLIAFATWADTLCPLTLDHDHLVKTVEASQVSPNEQDRATAIGDAVALGVERMSSLEQRPDLDTAIKSKVMILLTDGESNAGDIDPITAARMAAAFDIKIYTIGAGSEGGMAPVPARDPFSGRVVYRQIPVSIDEKTLTEIADITGGRYFRAKDADTLQEVYAQIDQLERTEIQQNQYTDYKELSVESARLGPITVPPLLPVVLVLLAAELALANTRFRTLP